MPTSPSLARRLLREMVPTFGQMLLVLLGAIALILGGRSSVLLRAMGITPEGVAAAGETLRQQFEVVLASPLVGNVVLIVFWASIGMAIYLMCWVLYATWVEAQNEVVLERSYTNRAGHALHWRPMAIKAVSGAFLVGALAAFGPVLALSQLVAGPLFVRPAFDTGLGLAAAVGLLSFWLYVVLLFVQLAFTPWYDEGAFTT